jgi:hypothetical protein
LKLQQLLQVTLLRAQWWLLLLQLLCALHWLQQCLLKSQLHPQMLNGPPELLLLSLPLLLLLLPQVLLPLLKTQLWLLLLRPLKSRLRLRWRPPELLLLFLPLKVHTLVVLSELQRFPRKSPR